MKNDHLKACNNYIGFKHYGSVRTCLIIFCLFVSFFINSSSAQCIIPPNVTYNTGNQLKNNDIITTGKTEWFGGGPGTIANLTMRGGVLTVSGDLTIQSLSLDSGSIFIAQGGSLTVANGGGLVLKGNSSIYNFGTFICRGNLVMDNNYVSASKPNILFNAANARLDLSYTYFVINNPFSFFENDGVAQFHGIITDNLAASGSVCLGNQSQTIMSALYNKVKDAYVAPSGRACVSVAQTSQFYGELTSNSNINVCLSTSYSGDASCAPYGCKVNDWGAAQAMQNCASCATSTTPLAVTLYDFSAKEEKDYNEIRWQSNSSNIPPDQYFLQRSNDGFHYLTIDSFSSLNGPDFVVRDKISQEQDFYYRIMILRNSATSPSYSKVIYIKRNIPEITIYPNPFQGALTIHLPDLSPSKIVISDLYGREVQGYKVLTGRNQLHIIFDRRVPGIYFIQVNQNNHTYRFKVMQM